MSEKIRFNQSYKTRSKMVSKGSGVLKTNRLTSHIKLEKYHMSVHILTPILIQVHCMNSPTSIIHVRIKEKD